MIADIIIIIIMFLCIFLGYRKGLIGVAVRIIGFFGALIIALILYNPISNYLINNTEIVTALQENIQSRIYSEEEIIEEDNIQNNNITETMGQYIEDYTQEIKTDSSEYISREAAIAIVRVGTWVGIFLIARILMIFIKIFASIISKIPIIKQFNKARRNHIWHIGRIYNNIYSTCNNKHDFYYISNQ